MIYLMCCCPRLATERGAHIDKLRFFLNRRCGWCSLPLHHQMVRRRQLTATSLGSYSEKMQKESPQSCRSEGFRVALIEHIASFLPNGIIAYAYLKINIPYFKTAVSLQFSSGRLRLASWQTAHQMACSLPDIQ